MTNRSGRIVRIAALIIVVLAGAALLNYHKDLIQYFNIRSMLSDGLDGRLVPHRINHPDRLEAVLENGIRSLEVDVVVQQADGRTRFAVGHGRSELTGVTLDQYFRIAGPFDLKKLWVDIKELQTPDLDSLIAALDRLDEQFGIKSMAIIESSLTDSEFARVTGAGYHASYYLPTGEIRELLATQNDSALDSAADRIAQQVGDQEVSAVSFDLSLYSFVKNYLEPRLPNRVVYHTWDSIKLWESGALDGLKAEAYYQDPRVKTILYKYWGSGVW